MISFLGDRVEDGIDDDGEVSSRRRPLGKLARRLKLTARSKGEEGKIVYLRCF